jgi:sugar-specific transcriptional regulator TrmB
MEIHLKETLEEIGLTKGEIEVYIRLLELGKSSAGTITKKANIGSSKVYEVLQRLIYKGLTNYIIEFGVRKYSATKPDRLLDYLKEKKERIESSEKKVKDILPFLEKKQKVTKDYADASIYKGKRAPLNVLNEIIDVAMQGHEILGFGSDEDDLTTLFPAKIKEIERLGLKNNFKIRVLFGKGYKNPNKSASMRWLPREYLQPTRTIIYLNKVIIIDFTEEITTIIIEKETIAKAYRQYFETLWNIAEKS